MTIIARRSFLSICLCSIEPFCCSSRLTNRLSPVSDRHHHFRSIRSLSPRQRPVQMKKSDHLSDLAGSVTMNNEKMSLLWTSPRGHFPGEIEGRRSSSRNTPVGNYHLRHWLSFASIRSHAEQLVQLSFRTINSAASVSWSDRSIWSRQMPSAHPNRGIKTTCSLW